MKLKNHFAVAVLAMVISANAQPAKISVSVNRPGHKIAPTLWGVFFEDINLSADGGIYPELVRNRSFEDAATDEKTGDVILGVVNANTGPLEPGVDLRGARNLTGQGTAAVLTAGNGTDENSLAELTKVSPKTETVKFSGTKLTRSFPGNSFTVLRLRTK